MRIIVNPGLYLGVMMRVLVTAGALVLTACGSSDKTAAAPTAPSGSNTATVSMPGNAFAPVQVIVTVGGTVSWDFPSTAHNVIFDARTGAPTDIPVTASKIVTRTFGTKGTFPYQCTLHSGMIGTVIAN